MNRVYLVKKLSPWMIEELKALAQISAFKLVLLRDPDSFYNDDLKELLEQGIIIDKKPYQSFTNISRVLFALKFIVKNIAKFSNFYSAIIGVKAVWWFLFFKDDYFKESKYHAQFATQASILSYLVCKFRNDSNSEYSFTFHAYDIYFNNKWFVELVNNSKYSFSISEYNIRYVSDNYPGLDTQKINVSRLGTSKPKDRSKMTSKEYITIGFISWFVEKKGVFYLLKAIKVLINQGKKVKLLMAGDGPLKDAILDFITKENLSDDIDYLGKINNKEKEFFFRKLDLLALPAISLKNDQDGIPVVLMEASSYSIPILTTNISGIPEICKDGYNGFLISEKNVVEIVNAIEKFIDEPGMRNEMSINSLKMHQNYDIVINTKKKAEYLNWSH